MWLRLILDDENGKELISQGVTFNDEAILGQLIDKIEFIFNIKRDYQQLFFKDKNLEKPPSYTLSRLEIRDCDEIHVKHMLLQNWVSCLGDSDKLRKTKWEHKKSRFAKEGSKHLRTLEDANFFVTFPTFKDKFWEISDLFDRYIIGSDECLKLSVECYFKKYFKKEKLNMDFINKSHTGAQGGLICRIIDGVDEQFFVKGHEFVTLDGSGDSRVDRRELLVYRLLHLIGVGPEPHFIPNAHSRCYTSKLTLFIATKEVPGFQRCADLLICDFAQNYEIQLDLLRDVFYLRDLNLGNYGLDGSQKLAVVDFGVSCPDDCIHQPAILNKYSNGEWGDVCKEAWNKWNMLGKFNEAKDMVLNDYNQLTGIHWREGYDDYLKTVLENINLLNKLLS